MKADVEKKPKAKDGKALAMTWPASKVVIWPIDRIKPYPKNVRTHPHSEIEALAKDMLADGVTAPIFVHEETEEIIYGHARIKDNQRALMAGWDLDAFRFEIGELKLDGVDVMPLIPADISGLLIQSNGDVVLDPSTQWTGMPEFEQPDAKAFRSIIVHFNDQKGVDKFAKTIGIQVTEKTKFIHYPEVIIKPFVKVRSKD